MLAVAGIGAAVAANPIREGNMISGHVLVKGSEENIPYATVLIVGSGQGTVSNEEGQFEFKNLPAGKYTLRVSAVGYKTQEKAIEVNKDFTAVVHFQMEEESFMTDEVVVSANRNEVSRKAAPVVVNVMSAKLFEMVKTPPTLPRRSTTSRACGWRTTARTAVFPRCVSTVWKVRTRKS